MDLWHAFCGGCMQLYHSMHLLPSDHVCPPSGQLQRLCKNFISIDPWAGETHCGSCRRCRSLSLACIVQLQPRSVRQTVQLPLLVARSMTHGRTAHCCLAVAMCLVAACSPLDRHKPHPRPSPSGDDCPVCTGAENVPHPGHFDYYLLAKYASHHG